MPFSDQLGGGGWSVNSATVTSNITTLPAPDGSITTDAMTSTAAGANIQDAVANPALYDGAQITASVFLCVSAGSPSINLHVYEVNSSGVTTSIVSQSVALSSMWQRFSVTGMTANGIAKLYLQIGDSAFPSGQTIFVWGAQMVLGGSAGAPSTPPTRPPATRRVRPFIWPPMD